MTAHVWHFSSHKMAKKQNFQNCYTKFVAILKFSDQKHVIIIIEKIADVRESGVGKFGHLRTRGCRNWQAIADLLHGGPLVGIS